MKQDKYPIPDTNRYVQWYFLVTLPIIVYQAQNQDEDELKVVFLCQYFIIFFPQTTVYPMMPIRDLLIYFLIL